MLNKLKKIQAERSDQKGFTIIEVMIVLAIAGLIILIVLLAVPALQRNGRNTAIKNDAGIVAAGISTSVSDNDGKVPTSVSGSNGTVTIVNATSESVKSQGGTTVNDGAAAVVPVAATLTQVPTGTIQVFRGQNCGNTASTRAISVYYSIETSGINVVKCIDA